MANFSVKHQPRDVCLFFHHLRLPPRVSDCIFLHMTSRFFFACGPHYCHLAELHYRKRANETQESRKDRERETGRERDSPHQMEGEFNLYSLGGVEGLSSPPVSPPSDFSELLPQRAQSAAPFCFRVFFVVFFYYSAD